MIIKQLETKYGIKGKTAVHRQAWKEAYVGLANRSLWRQRCSRNRYAQDTAVKVFHGLLASEIPDPVNLI